MQVNSEKTQLALKVASSEISNFVMDAEKEVKSIEERFASIVPDASNKQGYDDCKKIRAELLPIKTGLENARQQLKRPIIDAGKLIDGSLSPLAERVQAVYKPFESAYREVDNEKKRKEEERKANVQKAFDQLTEAIMTASGSTSSVIEAMIEELSDFDLSEDVFQERREEAAQKYTEVMQILGELLTQAVQREEFEAKQREIEERERKIAEAEQRERDRIAAEEARAKELERQKELEQARKEAEERAKVEAQERHKIELEQAEMRAKEQAELAAKQERERIEAEERQRQAEAEARERDKKHKASIHNGILEAILTTGVTEEQGKKIITLVAKGKVPSMCIQY